MKQMLLLTITFFLSFPFSSFSTEKDEIQELLDGTYNMEDCYDREDAVVALGLQITADHPLLEEVVDRLAFIFFINSICESPEGFSYDEDVQEAAGIALYKIGKFYPRAMELLIKASKEKKKSYHRTLAKEILS